MKLVKIIQYYSILFIRVLTEDGLLLQPRHARLLHNDAGHLGCSLGQTSSIAGGYRRRPEA